MPDNQANSEPNTRDLAMQLNKVLSTNEFIRYVLEVREIKGLSTPQNSQSLTTGQQRGLMLAVVSPRELSIQHECALFLFRR